jgi:dTMP kinase
MPGAKGFISFEGVEGAGKSTQIRLLAAYLRSKGHDVLETAEPGATRIGKKIRALLLDPQNHMDPLAELLLYYADRAQHVREIVYPAIMQNKIVITDRFTDSTAAYQGHARGLDLSLIHSLNDMVVPDMKPFLTIILDIDVEEGLKRNRDAQKVDRFEQETVAFHNRVRQGFHQIARDEPERVKIVDASKSKDEVTAEIIRLTEEAWR